MRMRRPRLLPLLTAAFHQPHQPPAVASAAAAAASPASFIWLLSNPTLAFTSSYSSAPTPPHLCPRSTWRWHRPLVTCASSSSSSSPSASSPPNFPTSDDSTAEPSPPLVSSSVVHTQTRKRRLLNDDEEFAAALALDLETTDKDPSCEIVQIAVVCANSRKNPHEPPSFFRYVLPRGPISPSAQEVHGISKEFLEECKAQPVEVVLRELREWVDDTFGTSRPIVWAAHNGGNFDFPIFHRVCAEFLPGWIAPTVGDRHPAAELSSRPQSEAPRESVPPASTTTEPPQEKHGECRKHVWVDTCEMARLVQVDKKAIKGAFTLSSLYTEATGTTIVGAHDAEHDARALAQIWRWLVDEGRRKAPHFADAVIHCCAETHAAPRIDKTRKGRPKASKVKKSPRAELNDAGDPEAENRALEPETAHEKTVEGESAAAPLESRNISPESRDDWRDWEYFQAYLQTAAYRRRAALNTQSMSLEDVPGVGAYTASFFKRCGVRTVDDLRALWIDCSRFEPVFKDYVRKVAPHGHRSSASRIVRFLREEDVFGRHL